MKIIVANEHEKTLMNKFLEVLREDGLSVLEEYDEEGESPILDSNEFLLLHDNLIINGVKVIIDENETEMSFENDWHVVGKCIVCGEGTEGTVDGEAPSYSEYLRLMSKDSKEEWKCEECYLKED